jgi:glycosyltransferase involved in cell wall biosynthesis
MKVLTIINSANMGGVEKTLLSCLKNMDKENIQMSILCFSKGGTLEEDFKKLGVEFLYIKKTGLITLDFIQLFFLLLKHRFDVVHSRFGFTSGGFVLASILAKRRVYISYHNTEPSTFRTFKKRKLLYRILTYQLKIHKFITLKFATKIIGHSKANLDTNFKDWKSNPKFELIYNGVDFNELDSNKEVSNLLNQFVNEGDFVILHIGSFREQKNHSFLIDCFQALKMTNKNVKLILVGSGSLFKNIKEKVEYLKLQEDVFFAGYDANTKKYFDKSHLFFLPSLNEGLANVLIEAQYKNIPICVSNLPSLQESGYIGYHKYYFNPYDKEMALVKLKEIINDIKDQNLNATKARANEFVIDNFTIQSMVANLMKIYKKK